MLLKNRFIWSDNGTLKGLSDAMNNHVSQTKVIPIVSAEDYIYLGSEAPFNHRWFEIETANTDVSAVTVELWDGSAWVSVAEVIDLTADTTGTKTLSQSGYIAWVPDIQETSWTRDDTFNSSGNVITGLGDVKIYNLFWVRLGFSADLTNTTELKYVGHKFANDEDLYSLWTEFDTDEARERFETGLTTFDRVHFEAAKQIIRDLKSDEVINSENQILEWDVFRLPSIHKAAEIIFSNWGVNFSEEESSARKKYKEAMQVDLFNIDADFDAELDIREMMSREGRIQR